ncbi:hypothetical protein B0J13DRAFT_266212 [Dactylonectria estremocensis]|uniref:Uncharacterized protein n=1 Tax=Dactylonectria estremocensis TaxID=1079267 RepID=A0A9P9JBE3_9HYPO|nr:hypothetical protein B0J13DRAFT_266212 [Dactylonectria estremocensis]
MARDFVRSPRRWWVVDWWCVVQVVVLFWVALLSSGFDFAGCSYDFTNNTLLIFTTKRKTDGLVDSAFRRRRHLLHTVIHSIHSFIHPSFVRAVYQQQASLSLALVGAPLCSPPALSIRWHAPVPSVHCSWCLALSKPTYGLCHDLCRDLLTSDRPPTRAPDLSLNSRSARVGRIRSFSQDPAISSHRFAMLLAPPATVSRSC